MKVKYAFVDDGCGWHVDEYEDGKLIKASWADGDVFEWEHDEDGNAIREQMNGIVVWERSLVSQE